MFLGMPKREHKEIKPSRLKRYQNAEDNQTSIKLMQKHVKGENNPNAYAGRF